MAQLDFPNNPSQGDIYEDAPNGIPYIYNNGKWEVYVVKTDQRNYWSRIQTGVGQDIRNTLIPRASDDVVRAKTFDIDYLPTLPSTFVSAFSHVEIGFVDGVSYKGPFHILQNGYVMTGLRGEPDAKRIYATRGESLMAMPGYVPPAGVTIPTTFQPVTIPGYVYIADDGSFTNTDPNAATAGGTEVVDLSIYNDDTPETTTTSTTSSSSSSSSSSTGGGYY